MRSFSLVTALVLAAFTTIGAAVEDWGVYSLVPASAEDFVLEAVGGAAADGTTVSINAPAGKPHQKWIVVAREAGFFEVKPAHEQPLALTAAQGGTKLGTAIVLEKGSGKPSQLWALTKHENGSYSLIPKHAPGLGLDPFGGKRSAGATIDLWTYQATDPHLRWFIRPLAGSGVEERTANATPKYAPPPIKPEDILPGTTKQFTFTRSRIFPGTVREVTVFIPAQYDGKQPACVYVKTDGFNPREKTLMETMIATKEMPVTIGVFVRPGDLPAPMPGTLGRRNRDFEYDGVSDSNVRFLIEELLPFIAQEYRLNLSTNGNDRCMSGGSSGGIAALTAAWNRPEAFSRVYAASGSWVAFRGGHEFPTMVRKFEAKPIRAFLTTATHDMENCAGDWFLLDQGTGNKTRSGSGRRGEDWALGGESGAGRGAAILRGYSPRSRLWLRQFPRGWPVLPAVSPAIQSRVS